MWCSGDKLPLAKQDVQLLFFCMLNLWMTSFSSTAKKCLNNIQWNHWFFLVTKKLVSHFYYLAGWHTVVTQQQPAHWPLTSPEASKCKVQMSWTSLAGCVQSYIYTASHIWLHEADSECPYGWKSRLSYNTDANAFLFSPGTGVTHIVLVGVHSLLLKNSTSHVVKCCLPFRITAACSVCSVIKLNIQIHELHK